MMVLEQLFLRRRSVHKHDGSSKQLVVIALYIYFSFYIHTLS